jgi:hypothetical protein
MGEGIADDPVELENAFCIAHQGFVPMEGTDADHVFPASRIRKNLTRLLAFLNANRELADILLAQEGISDFLRGLQNLKLELEADNELRR